MSALRTRKDRLPPEVNRVLFVKNLPFNIGAEDLYKIFGDYGAVRQIRQGNTKETRGTCYVVYEDIYDAKNACEKLSGFNVQNRYLIVLYSNPTRQQKKMNLKKEEAEIKKMQEKHGVDGEQHAKPTKKARTS